MLKGIRLISIDLDDTLWPCRPVIERAEADWHTWLHQHLPQLAARHDMDTLYEHRRQVMNRYPEIAHDFTEVRLRSLLELGVDAERARRANDEFRRLRNRVHPYAEVVPTLHGLRGHHVLISMTNGNAQVEHTPLRGLFHHQLSAAEVGAAKPDPRMFERALQLAACEAARALHIGDDPVRDIAPAAALGMRTLWIDRVGRPWPEHLAAPTFSSQDLAPLLGSVELEALS